MVEVRNTAHIAAAEVTARQLAADEAEEQFGEYLDEGVELEKDGAAIAAEVMELVGDETVSEEMDRQLAHDERQLAAAEQALATVMAAEIHGRPAEVSDAQARREEIEALGRRIKDMGLREPGDILRHVRENLGEQPGERAPNNDPTLQYGALTIMEKMFTSDGDHEMAKAVSAAADQLLAEHGSEIHKGMIVSEAAALYASEHCGTATDLRTLYMHEVVEHRGIAATFTAVVDKHGVEGFPDAVAFLLRAAGDDLATMTSGTDRAQQKEVLDNLYQLEVLNTMRERTGEALQTVGRSYPLAPDCTAQRVMRDTLAMVETPARIGEPAVTKLAHDSVPDSVAGRIAFLREYRTLASMIPIRVFDEADSAGGGLRLRERMTDAVIAAQDVADAEEQQKLASQ